MRYLLIESQGPWAGPNARRFLRDATALAASGHRVSVFLMQDGVFNAVGAAGELSGLSEAGAQVYVDRFSLGQRALSGADLSPHARPADLDVVAEALIAAGCRAVWH